MRAFRPLLLVIVVLLTVTFLLQNTWMNDEISVGYRLFMYDFGNTPSFPIWGLVLAAFFIGYVLGWSVGRIDIMSLRGQMRKLKRQRDDMEAAKAAPVAYNPVAYNPVVDSPSKDSTK